MRLPETNQWPNHAWIERQYKRYCGNLKVDEPIYDARSTRYSYPTTVIELVHQQSHFDHCADGTEANGLFVRMFEGKKYKAHDYIIQGHYK